MIRAVLFDWNNTLARFTWDDDLLAAGLRAGLEAAGRDGELWRELVDEWRRELWAPDAAERVDYRELVRRILGGASDEDVDRFIDAEFRTWTPARELAATTHALLESLRRRELKLGVVVNSWPDPARLLRADFAERGILERVDVAVFSDEIGARKPDARIFVRALSELGVAPEEAVFVGDRLVQDVGGAAAVGMTTVQALWFVADDAEGAPEPDYQAFTQMDVLNIVRRLNDGA